MLVHSANDIAVAISQTVGGSEAKFVAEMNTTARSLGMSSTHYDNPNGLPSPRQLTTARDLAVLARAIMIKFPEFRGYFRIQAIQSGRQILRSQNALLERYPGATG
jgi:D-alanyl-D-alanine carboxypeptidase